MSGCAGTSLPFLLDSPLRSEKRRRSGLWRSCQTAISSTFPSLPCPCKIECLQRKPWVCRAYPARSARINRLRLPNRSAPRSRIAGKRARTTQAVRDSVVDSSEGELSMAIPATQLRPGMVIKHNNDLHGGVQRGTPHPRQPARLYPGQAAQPAHRRDVRTPLPLRRRDR